MRSPERPFARRAISQAGGAAGRVLGSVAMDLARMLSALAIAGLAAGAWAAPLAASGSASAAAPGPVSAPVLAPASQAGTRTAEPSTTAPAGPQRCHLPGLPQPAWCATLDRPIDAARPTGPRFALHYAVLPALARHKADDPVVFFAGGPGQSAIDLAAPMAARFARVNQRRDLVFIDQRGTGRSAPLHCPDDQPGAAVTPLAQAWSLPQRMVRLEACRLALQKLPHGDLRHYSTSAAMQDVEAVRQALGVARLNLVGGSYGTRAALEYLRQYPRQVRRVVLDGVVPPDMRLPEAALQDNQAAWQALLQACTAEPRCAAQTPELAARWQALLATLPRRTSLRHPVTGQPEEVLLDADTLQGWLRAPLYAPWLAAALPAAMTLATQGEFQPLMALGSSLGAGTAGLATGQHFSVVCSEDLGPAAPASAPTASTPSASAPKASAATASAPSSAVPRSVPPAGQAAGAGPASRSSPLGPGADLLPMYLQACANWPRALVPAGFYTVPAAAVPVWLLSGGLDPVTPPRHGVRVARALGPWARHIVAPQAGHGLLGLACVRQAVQRFIDTDDDRRALESEAEPLSRCLSDLPRPLAFAPPGRWPTASQPLGAAPPASSAGKRP